MSTPSQRYAAAQQRAQTPLGRFAALYDFGFDQFQTQACQALAQGQQVLVAAPTGSGKTLVGEFAVHLALEQGRKCFYTTPIKALSNQKYHDLLRRYGPDRVGLLTGDNSINGEAAVVVMTTEVLRNMLYENTPTLAGLGFVVMDEVHYLADRSRGAVWEEVIVHLPESVQVAALSATVSNVEEFGAWLESVRGQVATVVEEHRPVPLWQHLQVGRQLYDLFSAEQGGVEGTPPAGAIPAVNPHLLEVVAGLEHRAGADQPHRSPSRRRDAGGSRAGFWSNAATRPPGRATTVDLLDRHGLLPAIVFIFSRAGCDNAVRQCVAAGVRLTSTEQAQRITALVREHTDWLSGPERLVLGYEPWLEALQRGVACHHAGMLPVFKQVVEQLFTQGLIQVVFATETLALGINMPARSVVLERLVKFNGQEHLDLTPGEYTQLTGRAGRRGIDIEGHAVVQWSPGVSPQAVAGLASTRTYPLRSSFAPTYNMAVNLLARLSFEQARQLLETSFAQFQADQQVVGLATTVKKLRAQAETARSQLRCPAPGDAACGTQDLVEYAQLYQKWQRADQQASRAAHALTRTDVEAGLRALRIGDVVVLSAGRRPGLAVVVTPADPHPDQPARPLVVTAGRQARRISQVDVGQQVQVVGRVRVPRHANPRNPAQRRDLASTLRASGLRPPPAQRHEPAPQESSDHTVKELLDQVRAHRCHRCRHRREHLALIKRYHTLHQQIDSLTQRMNRDTGSIARRFDRICALLEQLGYVQTRAERVQVSAEGARLARLYGERDLLVAHCLRQGTWLGLEPAALVACVSGMVYQSRREQGPAGQSEGLHLPAGLARQALIDTLAVWRYLHEQEAAQGLAVLPEPDFGFAAAAWAWAQGDDLADVLEQVDLQPGDFLRWIKQIIDVLDQMVAACAADTSGKAAGTPAGVASVAATASAAIQAIRRGIVTYADPSD